MEMLGDGLILKQQNLRIMEHGWLQILECILTQWFWQFLHEMEGH